MNQIKLFIELTRLKRPIGFMLLFWPCLWGLTIVYDFNSDLKIYFFYSALFLSGSILMRSAGCIVNDIADKNFDKKVERTKNRPIASGKVSVKLASTYALILCAIAFLVLINFNNLYDFNGSNLNASSFYLPLNEKNYLLASIISRDYI
jgi:4-hydroxybenzoate polyprenyltransferase